MNLRNDDKHLQETTDRPPLPPEPEPGRGHDGKRRPPPPPDKLVYSPAIQPGAPPTPPAPLLIPEPAG
ncbi:hypothetical protein C1I98_15390 [Spongiactinospora gelatinilytica]|uniref:Uncharacterized protein n=1 Tax=Spongiactinospora gelatinilytica TaxID=2666298 RepID=A0A2W2H026_9ACTN|nr:hypothetical protein [Spongiactinospora gelatinilytica]PZG45505.1 hypothetical protein C1I98_15390 [Spongiactinospora gelatinilytica]